MNTQVIENYSRLKYSLFYLPLLLLLSLALYLFAQQAWSTNGYVNIQKDCFFYINSKLSHFPNLIFNLTQFGDALIFLSLLSVFIVYAPVMWESLISASLISSLASNVLKNLFSIPRPAAMFDANTFVIIGQKLPGHNSLPSGHSITIFTTLTILLFAFMPQKFPKRLLWVLFIVSAGLMLAFTRVGVGAHYPLDVLAGSTVGYLSGLAGIFFSRKFKVWAWLGNKRYYPVLILLLLACSVVIIGKIMHDPLQVYYLTMAALIVSLYKLVNVYIKK
jgi:membrane-associated phospholipid phosphatase